MRKQKSRKVQSVKRSEILKEQRFKNLTAKHANVCNKSAVHVCKKNKMKSGYVKHKKQFV